MTKAVVSLRTEFRKAAELDKKDFAAIEHLLRRGRRQLESLSSVRVKNLTVAA